MTTPAFRPCLPRAALLLLAAAFFSACSSSSSKGTPGDGGPSNGSSGNLIVNGNAEQAAGSMDGTPVATPGWTSTGEATAVEYGVAGYPDSTVPGPSDRGMNLFIGGIDDAMSSLTQTADVSRYGSAIDGGKVTYTLSAWLGGYQDQDDSATLTITFQSSSGGALGTASLGPVLAADRADMTELLQKQTTGTVPSGTRSVLVVLSMVRTDGTNNDGYADDLSLVLDGV